MNNNEVQEGMDRMGRVFARLLLRGNRPGDSNPSYMLIEFASLLETPESELFWNSAEDELNRLYNE